MKRPRYWLRGILLAGAAFLVAALVLLRWVAPRYVVQLLERLTGGEVEVERVRLSFPLTTTLTGIRLAGNTPEAALAIQELAITPRRVSFPPWTLWIDTMEIRRPLLRVTRTKADVLRWPALPRPEPAGPEADRTGAPAWRLHINSLNIIGGAIEFIDEHPASPFHGVVDHVSVLLGPVTLAADGAGIVPAPHLGPPNLSLAGMSFAGRGMAVGDAGAAAPGYCSGWFDPVAKDLQASCRLEPLALKAFDPYYHGRSELRVYTATLKSTSQWEAKANRFTGRVQLELDDLSEGDLSVRGRTIVDVKRITAGQEPRFTGEISISGPLDRPDAWQASFLPGDERVQGLVERLLEHGVTGIRVAVGGHRMLIAVSPSTAATMPDIEAMSREIQDALEILAAPPPEPAPGPAPEAPAEAAVTPLSPEAGPPAEAPAPAAPAAPAPEPSLAAPTPEPPAPSGQSPPSQPPPPEQPAPPPASDPDAPSSAPVAPPPSAPPGS